MIIPIGTNNPLQRRPVVNYALIALNTLVFLITYYPHPIPGGVAVIRDSFAHFKLDPQSPQLFQFVSYAFLHANWMHLIGNMLFLYIFGNNVNDKLGNVGYTLLYLGGAVFAGVGHAVFNVSPVLGASGAVATVTGAYMVLFPNTYVNVLYFLFFVGAFEIRALYFILFKLIFFDNIIEPRIAEANVAYGAHLAGYFYGIGLPMLLLIFKILPHSHFDLWALVRRYRQRLQLARMVNKGYSPYMHDTAAARKKVAVKVSDVGSPEEQKRHDEIMQLRSSISEAVAQSDLTQAAHDYLKLRQVDQEQVLPQQVQLDVANKLVQNTQYNYAAQAYEDFLKAYPNYAFIEQVQLMLGLVYSRYLHQSEPAKKHLAIALSKLSDPGQKQMCQDEIDRL
ncbi:MAG: rhomboid family intramembrane serine protease [Sedimentisphaerales bacterium]|nr:rhomboid family intramembrane serine protease [Sedimentisphaerales bacterium]